MKRQRIEVQRAPIHPVVCERVERLGRPEVQGPRGSYDALCSKLSYMWFRWRRGTISVQRGPVIDATASFLAVEGVVYRRHKACSKRRNSRSVPERNKTTGSANERHIMASCECACEPPLTGRRHGSARDTAHFPPRLTDYRQRVLALTGLTDLTLYGWAANVDRPRPVCHPPNFRQAQSASLLT